MFYENGSQRATNTNSISLTFSPANRNRIHTRMEGHGSTSMSEDKEMPPASPAASFRSMPNSPGGANSEVLKMVARVLRNMEGITSKNTERLRFLDPELKSTQSRIEVLEILVRANEDKISNLSTDLASIQPKRDAKSPSLKEIQTNNYIYNSKTKETSRTERLSSRETNTNTKYIIERQSNNIDSPKDTQKYSSDISSTKPSKFHSHDNILTCCVSADDDVFLDTRTIRKHESEPFMMNHQKDLNATNDFMKRLWGYEDVAEPKFNVAYNFPSDTSIDHKPSEECYIST